MSTKTPIVDAAIEDERQKAIAANRDDFAYYFHMTGRLAAEARTLELRNAELTARVAELEKQVELREAAVRAVERAMDAEAELHSQELAEAQKDGQWQSIETAPKDGTEIICWLDGPSRVGGVSPESKLRVMRWSDSYSIFGLGGHWTDGICTLGDRIDVTLWIPLPAAPLPEKEAR